MPRWAQSIRFRLSLAYALAVFASGAVMMALLLVWQVNQLDEPVMLNSRRVVFTNAATGEQFNTRLEALRTDEVTEALLQQFEREAYQESLDELRKASLLGLGLLFVVAFGTGWLLAGWSLRPMGRMAAVAREISGTELSRRIGLRGPDDELKDLADTFDEMLDRLQASFEAHRRFVQDASHELRNPLAVTQANLELVTDNPDADVAELRQAARIAQSSTERLSHIVDDLVAQARTEVPTSSISSVDLPAMLSDVAAELEASAVNRDLELVVDSAAAGDRTCVVHGDEAALRRAVTNLVVNAIRLSPPGSAITLAARAEGDCAEIAVADEGPGIDAADQQVVFDRFWRGEPDGKGLGLGLSIVRQVAERHGGRVELDSTPGVGSTFTIRVPMPVSAG